MKSVIQFLKEAKQEIRKVSWPKRSDTFRNAVMVIIVSFLVAAYLGGIDYIIRNIMERTI